ncbi:MAG: hypothetical protein IPM63_04660 [Acidobacteriota bacterium]|nr:MAG: hypothetical protein IPM63_04660 [Acidobacteriota bacterium]
MKLEVFKFGLAWAASTGVLMLALNILFLFILPRGEGAFPGDQILAPLVFASEQDIPLGAIVMAILIQSFISGTFGSTLAWIYNRLVDRG